MDGRLGRFPMRLQVTAVFVVFMLVLPSGLNAVCLAAAPERFLAPVDGPITRRFEEPLGPYAAGHRGIDFDVAEGTEVVASASGTVKFAGPVADDGLFITITHDAQLETTYSFLSRVDVAAGQKVRQGDVIGLSGGGHPGHGRPVVHFGAKFAGIYIDPEILLFGNLEDISEIIALAPLDRSVVDDPSDRVDSRPSSLEPFEPISAKPVEGPGAFAILGEKISGLGAAIVRAPRVVVDWVSGRASDVGRFLTNVKEAGRIAVAAVGAAASRTKGFLSRVGESIGGALDKAASWSIDAMGKVRSWLGHAVDKVRSGFGHLAKFAKMKWDLLGRVVKRLGRLLLRFVIVVDAALFVVHVAKGAVQQIACNMKGGTPPPAIPTADQMKAGAKPPTAPNDNIVITIAGIGSQTQLGSDGEMDTNAAMYETDLTALGYKEGEIYNFSYAGIQEGGGPGAYRLHKPYTQKDTYKSIVDSAWLLAEQIEEIHRRHPSKEIDLVAHSQGGLVAQYYLETFGRPDNKERVTVDHFVSLGTPHLGADSAQLYSQLQGTPQGDFLLEGWEAVSDQFGLPPPASLAARQMAEDSPFMKELDRSWDPRLAKTTTIAATWDLVVTPQHSRLRGAQHYTADLPNSFESLWAHGAVVDATSTKEIMYNALADTPSTCTALRNAVADHGVGRLVSQGQDTFFDAYGFVVNGLR